MPLSKTVRAATYTGIQSVALAVVVTAERVIARDGYVLLEADSRQSTGAEHRGLVEPYNALLYSPYTAVDHAIISLGHI